MSPRIGHLTVALNRLESAVDILPGEELTRATLVREAVHRLALAGGELPEAVTALLDQCHKGKTHSALVAQAVSSLRSMLAA